MDLLLPEFAAQFIQNSLYVLASVVVCSMSTYWFVFLLVPLAVVYGLVQSYFRKTSRELKRLEGVTRSPLVSSFQELLNGLMTVRAFDRGPACIASNNVRVDTNTALYFHYQSMFATRAPRGL